MSKTPANLLGVESNVCCCDVCGAEMSPEGRGFPFGALATSWETSAPNDGERYLVNLCKPCFFMVLSNLKRHRMVNTMFNDTDEDLSRFGLVTVDDANSPAIDVTVR